MALRRIRLEEIPWQRVAQQTRHAKFGCYQRIYDLLLTNRGEWFEQTFETPLEVKRFTGCAYMHRTMVMEVQKRGLAVRVRYLGPVLSREEHIRRYREELSRRHT